MIKTKRKNNCLPLNRVMSYRFQPLIDRLVEKKGLKRTEAEELYRDLMRFMFLCGTRSEVLAPSERIDLAWHEFLLFTKQYQEFCSRMFGFFVHHKPRTKKDNPRKSGKSPIANTLIAAREVFGALSANWDFPQAADCFGCSYKCARCDTPSTSCEHND